MKKILLSISTFIAFSTNSQQPSFEWAKLTGGIDVKSLTLDASSNVYSIGSISASGMFDFDPGPGTFILDGANGTGYVSKLTTSGNFVWAKQLPTGSPIECVRVDASMNVYIIGHFSLTRDFDPGPGVFELTSAAQNDVYILKLNASGDFIWAKRLGGTQADVGLSIAIDNSGNVYTTGYFQGTSDFDPGPGTFNMSSGTLSDCFISKLNSNGDFVWAIHLPGGFNQGHSIAIDPTGNIVVTGIYQTTKDFDPGGGVFNLTSNGSADVFIWKLDPSANLIWAKSFGGIGSDADEGFSMDASGNIYITGGFDFTPDFDPGPGTFTLTEFGNDDIYALKLNSSGDFVWAKQLGSASPEAGRDIAADQNGNVFLTGLFQNTGDFDPGPGVHNLTSLGSNDIYICKLDINGDYLWAHKFGNFTLDEGISIAVDAAGSVYTGGYFQGTVDFDPGPASTSYTVSVRTAFIHKFGIGSTVPLTLLDFTASKLNSAIELKWKTTNEINTSEFAIEWGTNGKDFTTISQIKSSSNNDIVHYYSFTHPTPASNENYYRLRMIDRDGRFSFSKVIRVNSPDLFSQLSIAPNPVVNIAHIKLYSENNESVQFYLHAIDGRTIGTKSFQLTKGDNELVWDLSTIHAGTYMISSSNKKIKPLQLIKR